jgi:hypothetical protein
MNAPPPRSRTASLAVVHIVALLIQKVLPWILAIVLMTAVRETAYSASGQSRLMDAWRELTQNIKVSRGFALVFGSFGILYGLQQRNLRRAEHARWSRAVHQSGASSASK